MIAERFSVLCRRRYHRQTSVFWTVKIMNFGTTEILLVVAVLFLLFGASRLPQLAKSLGQTRKAFKRRHARSRGRRDSPEGANLFEYRNAASFGHQRRSLDGRNAAAGRSETVLITRRVKSDEWRAKLLFSRHSPLFSCHLSLASTFSPVSTNALTENRNDNVPSSTSIN